MSIDHGNVAWARAVLQAALTPDAAPTMSTRFGDYELLEVLGRGATATVYRARQLSLNRIVALKVMVDADLASEAEIQRFRFGAEAAAALAHPNIAPIYHVGAQDGVPFLTMRLFDGGTLAHARERLRPSRRGVVTLVAKVAAAVHYAHERGVLHRDLKPANIVLDEDDEPFVVDFGFAKHLDERAATSKPSVIVGTMGYMAPEQAQGASRSLTFAADIYGLGAILYELLTGEAPYQGLSLAELVEKLTSPERVRSPRALNPSIDRELESVCLKCLEKDPRHRYATADELARDLTRWLNYEPIITAVDSSAARLWRWCRGRPALATLLAGTLCVLAATASMAISVAREQQQVLLGDVLQSNAYAAQAKAGQVLSQLREMSYPVARCASDPRVAQLLAQSEARPAPPAQAERLLIECGAKSLFDSVTILRRDGNERARLPRRTPPSAASAADVSVNEPEHESVLHRDYFEGAKRLAESGYRSVHVGHVLRSEDDGERQVSLSAPVFDADNQWLGVVSVTVNMRAFIESLQLHDSAQRMAVLAGVRESEANDARRGPEQGVLVLLHGRLGDSQGLSASDAWMKELTRLKQKAAGRDPFRLSEPSSSLADNPRAYPTTAFGKRWLSGFAPVGHTGYAVVVQTKYDEALAVPVRALLRLLAGSGAVFILGASAVLALAWRLGRRSRRHV